MLTLPIKEKWFNMILSGEKKEEYREIKPYYTSRFMNVCGIKRRSNTTEMLFRGLLTIYTTYQREVMFRNGYSKSSQSFTARVSISIGTGREEWGAEPGKEYYILTIHEILREGKIETTERMTRNEILKHLDNLHVKIVKSTFAENVTENEIIALTECKEMVKELEQYHAIGTVEEIRDVLSIISEGQDDADESGISTVLLHTLLEYAQYAKIGTVEKCRAAVEKQKSEAPAIWGDGYDEDGELIYDMYNCPGCGESYEIDFDQYDYCPKCGQAIDRKYLT